jgi:transcriptional regulator with XRE-family HTH domain
VLTQKEEQGLRLRELINALEISQTEFSAQVGVTQSYLSRVLSGNKSISWKMTIGISKSFPEVNQNWLTSGHGEMFLSRSEKKYDEFEDLPSAVGEGGSGYGDPLLALRRMVDDYREMKAALEAQGEEIARLKAVVEEMEKKLKTGA